MTDTPRLRDYGEHDPKCDDRTLYVVLGTLVIGIIATIAYGIHIYIGWWNLFMVMAGLIVLAILCGSWYFRYELPLFFRGNYREQEDEVNLLEAYGLTPQEIAELDEIEAILGRSSPPTIETVDSTDQAETVLWWCIFLALPVAMLAGWFESGTWVTLTHVVLSASGAAVGLWWTLTFLDIRRQP